MFNVLWSGSNRPTGSTPKRSNSLKPQPLAPKLTTSTTPTTATNGAIVPSSITTTTTTATTATTLPATAYPVPRTHLTHDTQWEHVTKQGSPSSPDLVEDVDDIVDDDDDEDDDDDGTLERLGYSQVDGVPEPRLTRGLVAPSAAVAPPLPSIPALPPITSASAAARLSRSVAHTQVAPAPTSMAPVQPVLWQEERERMRQQVDMALAAQRKAESERDRWERKVMEVRSNKRSERERDGLDSARSRREAEALFKEENDKLKTMVQKQTQQLDAAREETKQARAQVQVHSDEAERFKGEVEVFKMSLQEHAQRIEHLTTDRERVRKERETIRGSLSAEVEQLKQAHVKEVEQLKMSLQEHAQRIEYLTTERDRVRKERETIRGSLSADIEQLKQAHAKDIEQFKKGLDEVNLDRTQAHAEAKRLRTSLDAYAPKLDESVREIEGLRRELSRAKEAERTVADLKQRLAAQNRELCSAREESSALKKEFHQLVTLLEDRTSELKGAQSFLTTADAFSGVEVTNTLQRLNAEVLQSTAFMAECMVEQFIQDTKAQVSKTDEQLAACKRASGAIGGSLVHFLGTKKHKDDPILIQIAFQAYLTYHLRWISCAWIIGGEESHNQFVDAIYRSVHDKEAQAIAGRWRALTRAHVPSTPLDDAQLAYQISTRIISGLSDILLTTGCTTPKTDVSSALSSKFSEKLSFLISLAMRVNKIVGEDVTSGDFEVLAVPPGTAFDSTSMEDSYDDGGSAKAKGSGMQPRVLCATDLGLRKKTRVGMTGEKQWETKVLLKPKVALESVIDIMDE